MDSDSEPAVPEKKTRCIDRRFFLPQCDPPGSKYIWFFTDRAGAEMLQSLKPIDIKAKARYLYDNFSVLVQETGAEHFESVQAELQSMLANMEMMPEAFFFHFGATYIGNKNYNLKGICNKIVGAMLTCKNLIDYAPKILQQRKQPNVIWSRIVVAPMQSEEFSKRTLLNSVKNVNSEAAEKLFPEVGILKHCRIEPDSYMFLPDNCLSKSAKQVFVQDLNEYLKNMDEVEKPTKLETPSKHKGKPSPQLEDVSFHLKYLEEKNQRESLELRVKALELHIVKIKHQTDTRPVEQMAKVKDEDGHSCVHLLRRPNTWAGRNNRKCRKTPDQFDDRSNRDRGYFAQHAYHEQPHCSDAATGSRESEQMYQRFLEFQEFKEREKKCDHKGHPNPAKKLHF